MAGGGAGVGAGPGQLTGQQTWISEAPFMSDESMLSSAMSLTMMAPAGEASGYPSSQRARTLSAPTHPIPRTPRS